MASYGAYFYNRHRKITSRQSFMKLARVDAYDVGNLPGKKYR